MNGVPTIGAPVNFGPLSITQAAVTSTVPGQFTALGIGVAPPSAGRLQTSGNIIVGNDIYTGGTGAIRFGEGAKTQLYPGAGTGTDGHLNLTTAAGSAGVGLDFATDAVLALRDRAQTGTARLTFPGANGQVFNDVQQLTELTTIAAAATTDTTIQMPANAVILGVSVRVTVAIPTATTFTVGDSGSAARFSTAAVSVNLNSTDPGTKAGAYYNASALSIRITPNGTPAANTGRVRVTIYYYSVTPPTS